MSTGIISTVFGVLSTVFVILGVLVLIRALLSWFPAAIFHPVGRLVVRTVDPILRPFRRVLPTFASIDFSPLLAMLVLYELANLCQRISLVSGLAGIDVAREIVFIISQLVTQIIVIFALVVLLRLVLDLFNADPFHPLVQAIRSVSTPLVRPFAGAFPSHRGMQSATGMALIAYAVMFIVARVIFDQLARVV